MMYVIWYQAAAGDLYSRAEASRLDDAQAKCEAWRRDYNEVRPHSGIGNKPPASLLKSVSGTRPTPTD